MFGWFVFSKIRGTSIPGDYRSEARLSNCSLSLLVVLLQSLNESVGVVRGIVVDNIGRIKRVDFVDVLAEFASGFGLNLLALLETSGLNEGSLGFEVCGKNLCELSANVGKDVVGGELKEGLKGGQVSAHLDDVLKSFLGLIFKILGALRKHVNSEES